MFVFGFVGVVGYCIKGGCCVSFYNVVILDVVKNLIEFMDKFV